MSNYGASPYAAYAAASQLYPTAAAAAASSPYYQGFTGYGGYSPYMQLAANPFHSALAKHKPCPTTGGYSPFGMLPYK